MRYPYLHRSPGCRPFLLSPEKGASLLCPQNSTLLKKKIVTV